MSPARRGTAVGSRPDVWEASDGGHLPGDLEAAAGPVDVRAARRGGAHEQRRRAGDPARVLWRKGSFGTQSPEGSRFVEAMMTVVATLTQQHRNVLDYLTAACEAALRGDSAPSLLPTPDHLSEFLHPAA